MGAPGFWDDQKSAQELVNKLNQVRGFVKPLNEAATTYEDLEAMIEMAAEDESFAEEVPGEIKKLEKMIEQIELSSLLGGTHDQAGAILTIHARRATVAL